MANVVIVGDADKAACQNAARPSEPSSEWR
jgi:hypothetical protein